MALTSKPFSICLLFVTALAACCGQKLKSGTCPALISFANPTFTIANLVATWREYARSPSVHRGDWKCVTYTFTSVTANSQYSVALNGIQKIGLFSSGQGTVGGTVTVNGNNVADSTAGTYFTFAINYAGKTTTLNYYIVITDNVNYIVLYACQNFLLGKIESVIFLVKPGTLTDAIATAGLNALANFGVSRTDLIYPFTADCLM